MDTIKTIKLSDKLRLKIEHDCYRQDFLEEQFQEVTFISNHRDYADMGPMSHIRIEALSELENDVPQGYERAPVYAYIHSGIALSLGAFGCPWDSGVFGVLLFKKGEFGENNRGLESFVKSWNALLMGEVYGYVLEQYEESCSHCGSGEWVETDSCWGFYGFESEADLLGTILEYIDHDLTQEQIQTIKDDL